VKALSAILRIADALDREHRGKLTGVSGRIEGDTLILSIRSEGDRAPEDWTVLAKSGMLRDALGLDVRIADSSAGSAPPERLGGLSGGRGARGAERAEPALSARPRRGRHA